MKVIIAGSRTGFSLEDVYEAWSQSGFGISEVVSGGASGVDTLCEVFAVEQGIPIKQFIPDWNGHARNRDMGNYADALIALWDGQSKGTKGMIDYAKKKGLEVYVYILGQEDK